MTTFKALRIDKAEAGTSAAIVDFDEAQLMPGNVTVRVSHSTVNYKDGLAITGKNPVVRVSPMIGGVDFAGAVETSDDPDFKVGDKVVCNGWGLSETHFGGYAEKARVKGEWLVKLPDGISAHDAMAVGTAGYTAMLSVLALEKHGMVPAHGPVIVTGAAGGVGSFALMLLKTAGWHCIASTGRAAEADYLRGLGADEIIDRAELSEKGKPLGKERWAAGVDSVGSMTLANVLAQTKRQGAIAACGLAQGMDLPASVAPFILRGVALLGIDSVYCEKARRVEAWARLARDLDRAKLAAATRDITFDQVIGTAHDIIDGKVRGRVIVTIPLIRNGAGGKALGFFWPENAMTDKSDVKKGDDVEWRWGSGKGHGEVAKVHTDDVETTIKGNDVKRNASKDKPAVEVKTDKGAKVLKSTSEVTIKSRD